MGLTEFSFTPSEYVFLNGDQFAPKAEGSGSLALLCSDASVDGYQLAINLILAAILANEAEGALEISVQEKKKLFGSGSSREIYLRKTSAPPNWSGYTLESAVMFITSTLFTQQKHTLYNIVYVLLGQDRPDPWQKIIELVEWGLASSNWLIPVEGEAAAAFSTPFICPAKVRELALEKPVEPMTSLLTGLQQTRSPLTQALVNEIEHALRDRKSR
ncbi:MAG: hypothetical protein KBF64_02875 [Anaerolineaceae bacterium]|nr:hypothetical protein [Anaerolineaceae bacterium]